jgi:membrane protease YdiL (CAAX protease family)
VAIRRDDQTAMTTTRTPANHEDRQIDGLPFVVGRGRRTVVALVSTLAGLAIFNVARAHVIDTAAGIATNLLMAGALAGVAGYATLTARELGTERSRAGAGLRWGAGALAVVAAVVLTAASVPALHGILADDRVDVGADAMLVQVLVTIPLGTVVLEELAFRGLLLGLLRRVTTTGRAVLVGSVAFGLWHIASALASARTNPALAGVSSSGAGLATTVAATVLTTTVAGAIFCWLRLRSGSLLAPAIAHVSTNSVAFAVAWAVAR